MGSATVLLMTPDAPIFRMHTGTPERGLGSLAKENCLSAKPGSSL